MKIFKKLFKFLTEKEKFYWCEVSFTREFKIITMRLRQSEIDKINMSSGVMIISQRKAN